MVGPSSPEGSTVGPSFEELPDALEYYLANPHSDLKANLTLLDLLDQWGVQVQVTICTQVAISRPI